MAILLLIFSWGARSPRHIIKVLTTYLLQIFLLIINFVFLFCFVLNRTYIWTKTVRTDVAKTAKSELRFCLFIFLFLLPHLVSIRDED